jgi:hypothetical protein
MQLTLKTTIKDLPSEPASKLEMALVATAA